MRLRYLPGVFAVLVVVLVALPTAEPVHGCAVAPPFNKPVEIADETALIIWDATTKTEHFIRRASFQTEADDFGFLVPTPSQPELEAADDRVFHTLATITAPAIVTQPQPSSPGCSLGCAGAASIAPGAANVNVLEEKRVAGYDAAVLEADDAAALGKWLKDHDYPFTPALEEWVGYYVKAKWKITAFKIARPDKSIEGKGAPKIGTSALRMSFHTERPFFPYREPGVLATDKKDTESRRLLRVFVVSDQRVKGELGDKDSAWPGKVVWSKQLVAADRKRLLELVKLPADAPPAEWRLTEFEDRSSPRPGKEDLYFTAAKDQAPVERPPSIQYVSMSPHECVLCYALTGLVVLPFVARRYLR